MLPQDPRPAKIALLLLPLAGLCCCGDDIAYPMPPLLAGGALSASPVAWNTRQAHVGLVVGVAEQGDEVVVVSELGVSYFAGGLLQSSDAQVTAWRQAALLPAPDLSGDWLVGVDGAGRLLRLRKNVALEEVSERYGPGGPVVEAAAIGAGRSGFALEPEGLMVGESQDAARYPGRFRGISGGGGRLVAAGADVVRVIDQSPQGQRQSQGRSYPLPGVVAAVIDPAGRLVAATATALYAEAEGGSLRRIHEERTGGIRALARAGSGVWVALGDTLALLRSGTLLRARGGLLPEGALLSGSPTGDVWVLAGGQLSRFSEDGGGADEALWKRTILPIFGRRCSQCHLPGSVAAIDLSTYASWVPRRALIEQRVVQGRPSPMPPPGASALTIDEVDALKAWFASSN